MTRADTDNALAAERREADNTASALAATEQHVDALLAQAVILEQTVNELRVEIADLKRQLNPTPAFGVASHQLNFRKSIYARDADVEAKQDDLGNMWTRDFLVMTGEADWSTASATLRRHRDAGRLHHLTVGAWDSTNKDANLGTFNWQKAIARIESVADCIVELAGVNEPDGGGRARTEWLPKVAAHQAKLYAVVKSDPATAHIPVGLGALRWVSKTMFADLEAMCRECDGTYDFVNLHFYPGRGSDVAAELAAAVAKIRAFSDKPIIISEGGASSANMPLEEQARICADLVQAGHDQGVKVYLYELMDDPDASGRDLQSNFGLIESDFTDKPAAAAVRALVK